jgi:predicted GNAT family acetyltransferase
MEIQVEDNGKKGAFFIQENGKRLAEMSFVWTGDGDFIVDHTEVNEALNGKGIGKQLVKRAVEMAREKKSKLIPLCPFTKSVIERTKEFQDVLRK